MLHTTAPQRKLKIFLADPVHTFVNSRDIWVAPLNIGTVAAYTKAKLGDAVEFELFKFPEQLIRRLDEVMPDVLGVSNYLWNYELSCLLTRVAKQKKPDLLTIMGGPNITQTPSWMTEFFRYSLCDFHISWSGEEPFLCIIEALLEPGATIPELYRNPGVNGVWFLDPHTGCARELATKAFIKNLDDIPSPYLNGMMDKFIRDDELMPMLETSRGCPFKCTYCDWGSANLGKVTKYSAERLKAEIAYCGANSNDERLTIADANFGILKDHDLDIARYLRNLRDTTGWPGKVIMTWNQSKVESTYEIADCLRDMTMMNTSSQSLNPDVLANIKRFNISDPEWKALIEFCRHRDIDSYGEVMLALPGENLESFLAGLRYLFSVGIDFLNVNPLILLEGSEMNSPAERERYRMRTAWRLLENCYGVYFGQPVIEYQEMVIETRDLSFDDYIFARTVSWLIQMSWNLRRHDVMLRVLHAKGINPLDVFIRVVRDWESAPIPVAQVFRDFFAEARGEMFGSKEELIEYYSEPDRMEKLRNGDFRKMNTHYTSRVSLECEREFVDYYLDISQAMLDEHGNLTLQTRRIIEDAALLTRERYLSASELFALARGEAIDKVVDFTFDVPAFALCRGSDGLKEHVGEARISYGFTIDDEQRKTLLDHMARFSGLTEEYTLRKLQEPYHGIHKKHLLFRINAIAINHSGATAAE